MAGHCIGLHGTAGHGRVLQGIAGVVLNIMLTYMDTIAGLATKYHSKLRWITSQGLQ